MNNYIQPGDTLTIKAPAVVKSGDVVRVGAIIGIAAYDAALNADVEVAVVGVYRVPKLTTDVVAPGAVLYWDAAAAKATVTAGTGAKPVLGVATAGAGNGATVVNVRLLPGVAIGPA